ncbi:MAG: nickel pincer cofactor biosynthesis protein LarC, partial [Brevinematales bacterium]
GTRAEVILKDNVKQPHRNINSIRDILSNSSLSGSVIKNSLKVFENIAGAEARVHGSTVEEVHFHEVGALDSIVDIVGSVICLDNLCPDKILCSSVELGGGFVKSMHGMLPVPAPATAELLAGTGAPVKKNGAPFEMTTPTGAAILKTFVDSYSDSPEFRIVKTGYGIGGRDTDIPNVLRVFICEAPGGISKGLELYQESILETNLDDMNPESSSYLMEKLFSSGANDVFFTPIIMKKSRPAYRISVLCSKGDEDALRDILFSETSTFGIRKSEITKIALERDFKKVATKYGKVTVKTAYFNGRPLKSKLEFDEVQKIAGENNISYMEAERELKKETGI